MPINYVPLVSQCTRYSISFTQFLNLWKTKIMDFFRYLDHLLSQTFSPGRWRFEIVDVDCNLFGKRIVFRSDREFNPFRAAKLATNGNHKLCLKLKPQVKWQKLPSSINVGRRGTRAKPSTLDMTHKLLHSLEMLKENGFNLAKRSCPWNFSTLSKKRVRYRCFPVNFTKFLERFFCRSFLDDYGCA